LPVAVEVVGTPRIIPAHLLLRAPQKCERPARWRGFDSRGRVRNHAAPINKPNGKALTRIMPGEDDELTVSPL
jgi:hypothetical protein